MEFDYWSVPYKFHYALRDHQNTVWAWVDESGAVAESYDYDAWGRLLGVYDGAGEPISDQQSQIGNRFLFQGREYSLATGLYHFRARWYDPVTGRWLSNDPIGISGGLNQYVFCSNDPVNCTDPLGLCEERDWRQTVIDYLKDNFIDPVPTTWDELWHDPMWDAMPFLAPAAAIPEVSIAISSMPFAIGNLRIAGRPLRTLIDTHQIPGLRSAGEITHLNIPWKGHTIHVPINPLHWFK